MTARRTLTLSHPIDLRRSLGAHRFSPSDPSLSLASDELWLALRTPQGPGTIHVTIEGGTRATVEAWGDGAALLIDRAPQLLGEDDQPVKLALPDRVAQHTRNVRGLRLVKLPSILPYLLVFIVHQKVVAKEAARSMKYLFRRFGEDAPGPAPLRVAPDWATFRQLGDGAFGAAGIDRKRAATIREVAMVHRRIESKWDEPPEVAGEWLRRIRGIGPWTEALVRGVVLGDPDAVLVGDYHLPNTVAYVFAGEPRADDERMLELLEPYRGQRWRVLRLIGETGIHAPRYGPKRQMRPPPGWDR